MMAESQSLVAQVRGMMVYGFQMYGAREGEQVALVRSPNNPYDNNCLDVRVVRGNFSFLLGRLAVEVAAQSNQARRFSFDSAAVSPIGKEFSP